MDVSDGLAKDLSRMAAASGIAATLDVAKVPMSTAAAKIAANSAEWRVKIVSTGDDYEILAAVAPDRAAGFKVAAQAAGITVSEIGRFAAGSGLTVIGADGAAITLDRTGWDHF